MDYSIIAVLDNFVGEAAPPWLPASPRTTHLNRCHISGSDYGHHPGRRLIKNERDIIYLNKYQILINVSLCDENDDLNLGTICYAQFVFM